MKKKQVDINLSSKEEITDPATLAKKQKWIKIRNILWGVFYLVAIAGICVSGSLIFHNTYYTSIYVSGFSMCPTLNHRTSSSIVDFGIADSHDFAIDKMKRFDVVITYYGWEGEDQGLKIKRVWGLPGETISLQHIDVRDDSALSQYTFTVKDDKGEVRYEYTMDFTYTTSLYMTLNTGEKTFTVQRAKTSSDGTVYTYKDRSFVKTLKENEYFVMGDNWTASSDCYSKSCTPLERSDIHGVVVAIEGYATKAKDSTLTNKVYTAPKINF